MKSSPFFLPGRYFLLGARFPPKAYHLQYHKQIKYFHADFAGKGEEHVVDGAADGGGGDRREEDPGGEEDGVDAGGGAEGGEQAAVRRTSEKIGASPESRNCLFSCCLI